ncbi:hypothetical protein BC739_009008 [Kutzneria viridogrisea]|uniref:Uncharacterized protein n=2 Tax=Kutzneria TaxID=43356 RepID=W5WLQ8_9PSEU|nr:hypothetical protein [Kutzneria albida]AHI01793.1 hypothetical protein KALB_8436 [Kutzneria albida DSM 43870]MBA8931756.1 hypothetical protein [Kutzneria viridogrisea]
MSGSLEVRKFLWQHDDAMPRGSTGVPAQRNDEPSRISSEQVHQARLAVARGALDVEDCRQLLEMLGLVPGEDGVPPVRR